VGAHHVGFWAKQQQQQLHIAERGTHPCNPSQVCRKRLLTFCCGRNLLSNGDFFDNCFFLRKKSRESNCHPGRIVSNEFFVDCANLIFGKFESPILKNNWDCCSNPKGLIMQFWRCDYVLICDLAKTWPAAKVRKRFFSW
jgi:hypothetical protein